MEDKKINLETLLYEYDKYVMSRLINKEYDINCLRELIREFSKENKLLEYSDDKTNKEVVEAVDKFIQQHLYKKMFEI